MSTYDDMGAQETGSTEDAHTSVTGPPHTGTPTGPTGRTSPSITDQVTALTAKVDRLSAKVDQLSAKVEQIKAKVDQHSQEIADLQSAPGIHP